MTEVENSLTTTNIRRKLALIMGISNYADNTSLINATNDAKEMSSVLKSMGFLIHDNEPKLNLTYKQMRHCLTDFECSIEAGDLVLFYFAGHGTQWEDQNYLIPADNFIEKNQNNMKVRLPLSGPELGTHAINVQNLLNSINDRTPFLIMFILDCCRTYHLRNPELQKLMRSSLIHHSQGLKAMPAHVGSLIAFACAPGTAADDGQNEEKNGLFTKHLLRHIKTPNEDIRMIMAAVTDGVIVESNNAQIPHITSVLRHKYICLYDGKQDLESKLNRWNQHAQTVAGNNRWGEQLSQLHHPYGICIDENRSIYIADWENHRIVQWTSNSNEGEIIIVRKKRQFVRYCTIVSHLFTIICIVWFFIGHIWLVQEFIHAFTTSYSLKEGTQFAIVMIIIQYIVGIWLLYCCTQHQKKISGESTINKQITDNDVNLPQDDPMIV
ncbi:hypothetical protein I4U23_003981 [Adineta vaga]|nr:hypothetical protein I4U23_003981 [Adineta vaga]